MSQTTLAERIMSVLAGTDSTHALDIGQIASRLENTASTQELEAVLQDLFDRKVVNTVRLSSNGVTWRQVYWETGLPLSKAYAPCVPKHDIYSVLKEDRSMSVTETTTSHASAQTNAPAVANPNKNGLVAAQAMAALEGLTAETAKTVDEIRHLCPASASRDALAHVLRDLHLRGKLHMRKAMINGRYQNLYWPATDGNGQYVQPEGDETKAVPMPSTDGRVRFALWDDGSLMIVKGRIRLDIPRDDVVRLASLLNCRTADG